MPRNSSQGLLSSSVRKKLTSYLSTDAVIFPSAVLFFLLGDFHHGFIMAFGVSSAQSKAALTWKLLPVSVPPATPQFSVLHPSSSCVKRVTGQMGSDEEMHQGPFQLENGKDGSPVLIAMGQLPLFSTAKFV